jgi:hypothetical protein
MLINSICIINSSKSSSIIIRRHHPSSRKSKGLQLWHIILIRGHSNTRLYRVTMLPHPLLLNHNRTIITRRTERCQGWVTRLSHSLVHTLPRKKMGCTILRCTTLIVKYIKAQRHSGNVP